MRRAIAVTAALLAFAAAPSISSAATSAATAESGILATVAFTMDGYAQNDVWEAILVVPDGAAPVAGDGPVDLTRTWAGIGHWVNKQLVCVSLSNPSVWSANDAQFNATFSFQGSCGGRNLEISWNVGSWYVYDETPNPQSAGFGSSLVIPSTTQAQISFDSRAEPWTSSARLRDVDTGEYLPRFGVHSRAWRFADAQSFAVEA